MSDGLFELLILTLTWSYVGMSANIIQALEAIRVRIMPQAQAPPTHPPTHTNISDSEFTF